MKAACEISYPAYLHHKVVGNGVTTSLLMTGNSQTLGDTCHSDPHDEGEFVSACNKGDFGRLGDKRDIVPLEDKGNFASLKSVNSSLLSLRPFSR